MTPLEKIASFRTLRVTDIPDGDLETLLAEPVRQAGYLASARVVINENRWWDCHIWAVVEFLKYNEQLP